MLSADVRQADRELLQVLRRSDSLGVAELIESLGVTATAVRQRLDRMLELGLVQRRKVSSGRGRPTYAYELSAQGHRQAGADPGQLAEAMWLAICELPDARVRQQLLHAVGVHLGRQYRQRLSDGSLSDGSLSERMAAMTELLADNRILAELTHRGTLPVLDVHACPFPDLSDDGHRREMCDLEQEMISEALGQRVQLSQCQLDGHECCQFSPVAHQV